MRGLRSCILSQGCIHLRRVLEHGRLDPVIAIYREGTEVLCGLCRFRALDWRDENGPMRICSLLATKRLRSFHTSSSGNTVRFLRELAVDIRVIIPHLGALNGGYRSIAKAGLWDLPNVYADTALASSYEIMGYIETYGHKRLLFGSDFPFGNPVGERLKVERLSISAERKEAVLGLNLKRLLSESHRGQPYLGP